LLDVPEYPEPPSRPPTQLRPGARIAIWSLGFVAVLAFAILVLNAGAGVLVGGTFITAVVLLADRIGGRAVELAAGLVSPGRPQPEVDTEEPPADIEPIAAIDARPRTPERG
jgi:hypothetical protein